MKLRKILCRGLGATLGVFVLAGVGGYCWLYSWSWGGAPAPHASLAATEAAMLQAFDTHIAKEAPGLQYEYMQHEILTNRAAGVSLDDEGQDIGTPQLSWCESFILPHMCARVSRDLLAPLRESLHRVIESGSAEGAEPYLAVLALQKKDVPLFRLLVEKGAPLKVTQDGNTICLLEQIIAASDLQGIFMPIAERIALMDWLVTRGADIAAVKEEDVLLLSEASIKASDDAAGAILDWFLRRGYELDKSRAVTLLLQYAGAFTTYQNLIEDGLLPVPPQELETAWGRRTPLQLAAGAREPAPDMLRWLLSLGYNPNALPGGDDSAQTPLDACLTGMQYLSMGLGEAEDTRLRGKLEMLDILLQHGALPTAQTRELLPINAELEREIVELFRKHGHHITAGADPYNACCVPE